MEKEKHRVQHQLLTDTFRFQSFEKRVRKREKNEQASETTTHNSLSLFIKDFLQRYLVKLRLIHRTSEGLQNRNISERITVSVQ